MNNNSEIASQELTGIFERREKKFLVEQQRLESFLNKIHTHLTPDERGVTKVSSLYYDTPENTLISRSLEKPVYKEKLRIRAYGEVSSDSIVFVELKKKFKGIVYKRRFGCALNDSYAFMQNGKGMSDTFLCSQEMQGQTMSDTTLAKRNYLEVKACKNRYRKLEPKMLIVTNRLALYTNDGSGVRLTIDFQPCFDSQNLKLDSQAPHQSLIDEDVCILEIKSANALPMWMIEAMSEARIRPQSFSKYGHAFKISKEVNMAKGSEMAKSNVSGVYPKHARVKEVACV